MARPDARPASRRSAVPRRRQCPRRRDRRGAAWRPSRWSCDPATRGSGATVARLRFDHLLYGGEALVVAAVGPEGELEALDRQVRRLLDQRPDERQLYL